MAIIAAIDENERSTQVVEIAYDLAEKYDDELIALHVVPRDEFESHQESLRKIPGMEDFSLSQQAESAKQVARRFVQHTIDDVEWGRVTTRGRVGDIANEILKETESVNPRFLVISGRRRSPTGKAIFGNTAQEILLKADCPVVSKLSDD